MTDALARVLAPIDPALRFEDLGAFARDHREATRAFGSPFDRAIAGASRVHALGHAFCAGYRAALVTLVPGLPEDATVSLAATEERGAHPRAIETTLAKDGDGLTLHGKKRWITAPPDEGVILVVARDARAERADRPTLRLVRVNARANGAVITLMPKTPFVPEIPHASLVLENVRVAETDVLRGDGYDDYLKPFRTIEDVHVLASVLAWVCANAVRAKWPREFTAKLAQAICAARDLAQRDARAWSTHVALGGLVAHVMALAIESDAHWPSAAPELRAMWERDRALLAVASQAREKRLERAWELASAARVVT